MDIKYNACCLVFQESKKPISVHRVRAFGDLLEILNSYADIEKHIKDSNSQAATTSNEALNLQLISMLFRSMWFHC